MKATSSKRLLAFIIDFFILSLVTSLLSIAAYYMLNIPSFATDYSNAQSNFIEALSNYYASNTNSNYDALMQSFETFGKYFLVNHIIDMCIQVILIPTYFILIPMFWEKQTIGRFALGLKVVRNDNELSKVTIKNLLLRELLGTLLLYGIIGGPLILVSGIISIFTGRSLVDYIGKTNLIDKRLTNYFMENNINPNNINDYINRMNNQDTYNDYNNNHDDAIDADINDQVTSNKDTNDNDDDYTVI